MNMLKFLEDIVNIDSRNGNSNGVNRANDYVRKQLEILGFSCELIPAKDLDGNDLGNHLLAHFGNTEPGILLLGHIDTVLGPNEVPFRLDRTAGKVYGAGVADLKGGIAIMLQALELVLEQTSSPPSMTVVINASEEIPLQSFSAWLGNIAEKQRYCLNFEPGILKDDGSSSIVAARKGLKRYNLTCRGFATHSGNFHETGANAAREIARKIEFIESLTDYERGITANVGRVAGGKTYNQVVDFAEIEFEVRSFNTELLDEIDRLLHEQCTSPTITSADGLHQCSLQLNNLSGFPGFPENPAAAKLIQRYISIASQLGYIVVSEPRGGASDSNFIADLLPTIDGIGLPGRNFHNPGEEASISVMEQAAQTAAILVMELK